MDPVTATMLIGTAVQIGGGLISYFKNKGDQKTAELLRQRALEKYGNDSEEAINAVAVETLPPSAFETIATDPALKEAQMRSLESLQGIADSGGMNLADDAALNKVNNQVSQQEAVARNRISDDMASRGIGGSGTELEMLRSSGQDGMKRRSEAAMDVNARAQQRALDAILGAGQMAGQQRSQEWGEKSDVAQARDAINKYNIGAINDLSRWQGDARLGVTRDIYQGEMGVADRKSQQGNQTAATIGGVAQGVGQGAASFAAYKSQQRPQTETLAAPGSVQEQKAMGVKPAGVGPLASGDTSWGQKSYAEMTDEEKDEEMRKGIA